MLCAFFGREKDMRQRSWVDFAVQCLFWQLLSHKTFFVPTLGLPTNLSVGWSWLFPASTIKFFTRWSPKSQWVYLAPHKNNSVHWLSLANNYNSLPYLFSSVTGSFRNLMPLIYEHLLQWQQNRSKLWCDYCIKFQLFEGAQDVFSRLTAVCCMLLPHNP